MGLCPGARERCRWCVHNRALGVQRTKISAVGHLLCVHCQQRRRKIVQAAAAAAAAAGECECDSKEVERAAIASHLLAQIFIELSFTLLCLKGRQCFQTLLQDHQCTINLVDQLFPLARQDDFH